MQRIKHFLAVIFTLAIAVPGMAALTPLRYAEAAAKAQYVDRVNAIVRIMTKASGRAQTMTIPVEHAVEFEKLEILVRACKSTMPFDARDNFMFVEVAKKFAVESKRIFSGWMTASEPGDNPLQDADYDLWLVSCE